MMPKSITSRPDFPCGAAWLLSLIGARSADAVRRPGVGPGVLAGAARADANLAAGVRARLGLDEAGWLLTAAAPISLDVLEFFSCLGLPLCEAFGMSETACLVATNTPAAMRSGSVGRAVHGAELRLDPDGELLIRGPLVMRGYRGMPEATSTSRVAAAPLAVAVQMKIGASTARLRAHSGTAVAASRTPV